MVWGKAALGREEVGQRSLVREEGQDLFPGFGGEWGAVFQQGFSLAEVSGEGQTGEVAAFSAIRLGQQFEDVNDGRDLYFSETGSDSVPLLPGIVDLFYNLGG